MGITKTKIYGPFIFMESTTPENIYLDMFLEQQLVLLFSIKMEHRPILLELFGITLMTPSSIIGLVMAQEDFGRFAPPI